MKLSLKKPLLNRRRYFQHLGGGLGQAALLSLLGRDLSLIGDESYSSTPDAAFDLKPNQPHFAPKANSVIHLFMNGGPSQMDLFDPKPELVRNHGK